MAAVGRKVLIGVGWFHKRSVTTHLPSNFTVVFKKDTLSLDHSVVNLMVGPVCLVNYSYEAVKTFFSSIPEGEYFIDVSPPNCWLFSGTRICLSLPIKMLAYSGVP